MKEKNRQFVIFGDFRKISSGELTEKLAKLKDTFKYQPGLSLDPDSFGLGQPSFVPQLSRPAFYSQSGNESIIFGVNRIVLQENTADIDNYDDFILNCINITEEIIKKLGTRVARIAVNGAFLSDQTQKTDAIYDKIFNSDYSLCDSCSDEWRITTNGKNNDVNLGCSINRVVNIIRGNGIISPDGAIVGPLVTMYDYNTEAEYAGDFHLKDIKIFADTAKEFRKQVKSLCSNQ